MRLGSKRPQQPSAELPQDWSSMRHQRPREMRLGDIFTDGDGKPLIGTPLGRRLIIFSGVIAKEKFKLGKLVGWKGGNNENPVLEYADGTYEVLQSLADTNWKS